MIGSRLNHYEILRKIGAGGMGDVYAARDQKLGREVALKILPARMARDEERLDRFRREATAIAALDHPNIVTVFSIEEADGTSGSAAGHGEDAASNGQATGDEGTTHFITMQLVEGKTLEQLIPQRGLPLPRFFEIAVPLADAIAVAHDHGVTHRDLKPQNIMVTEDGRVKVLDFGLAKLADSGDALDGGEESGAHVTEAATMAPGPAVTQEGRILGTVAYMSPEQAEGKPVDHRSDIFSLGIILYQMATGEAPFRGDSRVSILTSVVRDEPVAVSEVNRATPRHLARIISHSLAKDPRRRFQSALDVRNELDGLQRELASGQHEGVRSVAGSAGHGAASFGLRPAAAAVGIVAAVAATAWFSGSWTSWDGGDPGNAIDTPVAVSVASVDDRPSIAVLNFDNASGDVSLEWLRAGLPEMVVTDLSQSPRIRVLSTDRVYRLLAAEDLVDAPSQEAIPVVAAGAGVDRLLVGSILRAGERIRLVARLQDVATGEIVASRTLEGEGEDSIFDLVDELTAGIKEAFELAAVDSEADRRLSEVTTSSIEALRHWLEADRHIDAGDYPTARTLLESAVAIDPEFAMAYARLAAVHNNVFDFDERDRYARLALEHADHLTEPERLYVEGTYNYSRPELSYEALRAFLELLAFDPSNTAAANNAGIIYVRLDRINDAIRMFEPLIERNESFVGTWGNLCESYLYLGRYDEAEALIDRYLAQPGAASAPALNWKAKIAVYQERLDDARQHLEQMLALGDTRAMEYLAYVALLERRWDDITAALETGEAAESDAAARFVGIPSTRATVALYRGRSGEALSALRAALDAVPASSTFSDWLADYEAYVLEVRGELEEALVVAERRLELARRDDALWSLVTVGSLQAALGRTDEASATLARFDELIAGWPVELTTRPRALLAARLERALGDATAAIELLEQAAQGLHPHGEPTGDHGIVWSDLADAYRAAGDADAAERWYRRLVDSTLERVDRPVRYVRALYHLGQIYAERGDEARAIEHFRLFLEHWGDGDLDRAPVAGARAWLADR